MSFSDFSDYNIGNYASSPADLGFKPAELEAFLSSICGDVGTENTDTISPMSSSMDDDTPSSSSRSVEDTPSSSGSSSSSSNNNNNNNNNNSEAFIEVNLDGGVVLRVPASTLTQQGPMAVVQQLTTAYPPPSPWSFSAPSDLAQTVWNDALLPADATSSHVAASLPEVDPQQWADFNSSPLPDPSAFAPSPVPVPGQFDLSVPGQFDLSTPGQFDLSVPSQFDLPVPGQFDLPNYNQFDFPGAPNPAAIQPLGPVSPPAPRPRPRPRPRAASANATGHPRRKTPPGFPGYRWVAQQVALRAGIVQLGDVYAHMAAAWPDFFGAARPSGAWKSGVRHAVGKHFRRVPAGRAPAGGVWYELDPENVMHEEEMWRAVGDGAR
ncbi:hypothetical protein GTA08_BOTSDO00059 [Neofusicoccum parvum]|nr:hypothetical protein GTA08_BOTSDO00059 [Neofusicoccum parvum]